MAGETPEVPSPDAIVRELVTAGFPAPPGAFGLEPLRRNPERLDLGNRLCFRVKAGGLSLAHLTVGRDLADLAARTRAFAEACPDLSCKPLLWHRAGGWDFLGTEFFDGEPLDSLLRAGRITLPEAMARAGAVQARLDLTSRPSTLEAVAAELGRFFSDIRESPLFGRNDLQFLEEAVFPSLRDGALSGPWRTRWTNGDFVPANVLVDPQGNTRLVDLEFAARTHFFCEDRWRWKAFAALSPAGLELPTWGPLPPVQPWLEAYSILRQLVLSHRINSAGPAAAVAEHFGSRLVAVAAGMDGGRRIPSFLKLLSAGDERRGRASVPIQGTAQVFWSSGGPHNERDSAKVAYTFGREANLRFELGLHHGPLSLRLDPCDCIGLLDLSWIRVHADGQLLLELYGRDGVQLAGGLVPVPGPHSATLLSLGDDPILLLPRIDAGPGGRGIVLEASLRFSRRMLEFPGLGTVGPGGNSR